MTPENKEVRLSFPSIEVWSGRDQFSPAIGALWLSTAAELPIQDVLECISAEALMARRKVMGDKDKSLAFDYLASIDEMRLKSHARIEAVREKSEAEALILAMMVHSIVDYSQSKEAAMKHVVTEMSRAKSECRDDTFKHLFSRTSKRQIEMIWTKYEEVVHYSEFVAEKIFGDLDGFTRKTDPEKLLEQLRKAGLVRKAIILKIM